MNPDGTPIVPAPTEEPKGDETPAWAQALIDSNADLSQRISAFEETNVPPPVEEEAPVTEAWKPNSWDDVTQHAKDLAAAEAQRIIDANDAKVTQANDDAAKAAAEVDRFLDDQVSELTTGNKLPAVVNENDPNDPGKLAQRELYGFALSLGTADLKTSFNTLDALHAAGKQFDFVKMELVDRNPAGAGANSPVGSSSSGSAGAPATRPDYKTLHNVSLPALADRFMNNAQ
jgi:hypothetical protein